MEKAIYIFNKKRICVLAFAMLLVLVPVTQFRASGAEEMPRHESFVVGVSHHIEAYHFNPYNPTYDYYTMASSVAYESIYYYNPDNGSFYGWLCTGYEYSNDHKTLKWYVRPGVKWSDGEPFTAKDMVYTLKMIQFDPAVFMQSLVKGMVSVTSEDNDMTCVIKYAEPNPSIWMDFINMGQMGWRVLPEHICSEKINTGQPGGSELPLPSLWAPAKAEDWCATGPFVLNSSQAGGPFIWKRNDDYWGKDIYGLPKIKWVINKGMSYPEQNLMGVQNNEFDCTGTWNTWAQFLSALEKNTYLQWIEHLDLHPRTLYLNLDKYPLNYSSVRWALCHGINQTKLVEFPLEGHGAETTLPLGAFPAQYEWLPDTVGTGKKYDCAAYNPDEIVTAMTAIGCTKGSDGYWYSPDDEKISFEIYGWEWDRPYCEMVSDMIADLGFDVSFKVPGYTECANGLLCGTQDMNKAWQMGIDNHVHPFSLFSSLLYSGHGEELLLRGEMMSYYNNFIRWRNDTFDDIVDETRSLAIDDPKFKENCKKLYEIYYAELPFIPVGQPMLYHIANNYYWTGWPDSGGEIVDGKLVGSDPSQLYCFSGQYWKDCAQQLWFKLQPTGRGVEEGGLTAEQLYLIVAVIAVAIVAIAGFVLYRRRKH